MNIIRYSALIALLLAGCLASSDIPVAEGWRLPTKTEISGNWKAFAKQDHPAHLAQADFNGDGIQDVAYIAFSNDGQKWALFANMSSTSGEFEIFKLDENGKNIPPQAMGIGIAKPGKYKTACGKGYWNCEPGEPTELVLHLPGIDYFHFESANSFIWWDSRSKKFVRTWMSD
jgi:hypothetical protein